MVSSRGFLVSTGDSARLLWAVTWREADKRCTVSFPLVFGDRTVSSELSGAYTLRPFSFVVSLVHSGLSPVFSPMCSSTERGASSVSVSNLSFRVFYTGSGLCFGSTPFSSTV